MLEKFTKNKPVFYGTLAVIGIATIVYYRRKQSQAASTVDTTDASGDMTDQFSGGYAGDPYGGGTYGSSGGTGSYYNPPPPANANQLLTREDWLKEAYKILPGGGSAEVHTALINVLGGLSVTSAERRIFLEAVGVLGDPPGGYPKPIRVRDTPGHPSVHPVGKTTTVPDVIGDHFDRAQNKIQAAGLRAHKAHPDIHIVTSERPSAGTKVDIGSTVTVGGHS
jgi:hypothetical protein